MIILINVTIMRHLNCAADPQNDVLPDLPYVQVSTISEALHCSVKWHTSRLEVFPLSRDARTGLATRSPCNDHLYYFNTPRGLHTLVPSACSHATPF